MSAQLVSGRSQHRPSSFKVYEPESPPQELPISPPSVAERQRIGNPLATFGKQIAEKFSAPKITDADRQRAMTELTAGAYYREFMLPERLERVKKAKDPSEKAKKEKLDPKTLRLDRDALTWLSQFGVPEEWPDFEPWHGPPIGCFTPAYLESLADESLVHGLSVNTVGKYLRHLRTMFNHAAGLGMIAKIKVSIPTEEPEARPFTDVEVEHIYWALADHPALQVAFVVAIATGARFGDLFWLRWEQIDFEKRQVDFTAEKTDKRQLLPLADVAILHLNRLPRTEPPFASLVDISLDAAWRAAHYRSKRLNIQWRCLTGFAAPPRRKSEWPADAVPHPWHSARATAGVWIERVRSGMASRLLGHTVEEKGEKLTRKHYLVPAVAEDLREAAEAIQWPNYFHSISRSRQKLLF